MTTRKSGQLTRRRILETSAGLFMRQGYPGTGLKQISAESGAPFGSLYHFFPGGKEQLAAESMRIAAQGYQALVDAVWDASPDMIAGTYNCFIAAGENLRMTDYADACPIATVAAEVASTNEPLRIVTAEIFEGWIQAGTKRFEGAGLSNQKSRELMIFILSSLEGAFILSRAAKSTEPMTAAAVSCSDAVRLAIGERTG